MGFALIGDVHSQYDKVRAALYHCQENNLTPILLGDLFDSRCSSSDSVQVYKYVRWAQDALDAIVLQSNHQDKLRRFYLGNKVKLNNGLDTTVSEFREYFHDSGYYSQSEVLSWLESMPYGVVFKDNQGIEYRCAHAFFSSKIEVPEYDNVHLVTGDDMPRKMRDLFIYGPVSSQQRVEWWNENRNHDYVMVAGHYHTVHISQKALVLDGSCGSEDTGAFLPLYDVDNRKLLAF